MTLFFQGENQSRITPPPWPFHQSIQLPILDSGIYVRNLLAFLSRNRNKNLSSGIKLRWPAWWIIDSAGVHCAHYQPNTLLSRILFSIWNETDEMTTLYIFRYPRILDIWKLGSRNSICSRCILNPSSFSTILLLLLLHTCGSCWRMQSNM